MRELMARTTHCWLWADQTTASPHPNMVPETRYSRLTSGKYMRKSIGTLVAYVCSRICDAYVDEVCGPAQLHDLPQHPNSWVPGYPYGYSAKVCYSKKVESQCILYGNWGILSIVAFCNLVKLIGILYVGFMVNDQPIMTLGKLAIS